MLRTSFRLILWATLAALLVPAGHAQTRRAPTLDDMLDLVQVSSPQISPDGTRLLYTKSELKAWKDNKRVTSIWMARADGSDAFRFLANERDTSPQWSPDGKLVAFLSARDQAGGGGGAAGGGGAGAGATGSSSDQGAQLWLIRTDGGEAWKLSDHKSAIRRFEWADDGSRIFFSADDPRTEEERTAERQGDDVIFVDEGPNGQSRGRWSNLWAITIADKKEQQITKEQLIIGDFAPSPDGSRLAFTFRRQNQRNGQHGTEIAVADVATGAIRELTKNHAPESNVEWSPDGSLVSFTAPSEATWELSEGSFYVIPAAGGTARRIGAAGRGSGRYHWTEDGKAIVYSATRNARGGIFRMEVGTGDERTIAAGDWSGGLDSVTKDLARGAAVVSRPDVPGEVHVVDLESGTMTAVTRSNPQAADLGFARCQAVTWKSRDGLQVEGLLWLPADHAPGTKLPLLLSLHGGPAGVWSTSFRALNHVYVGLGWAVLEPNVRGSSSYGDALLRGNMKDIGGGDFWDAMTGVDHVIRMGIADPDRMAVRGWSYGGILTGWVVTQTDRFKAASAGAMVTDWASEYAMGFNHDVRLWYIGGTPWENPDGYRRQSSYTHIAKVKTPTIVIHGEQDTTDTIGQAMMFYQGLKDRGVPVRFLRFPREPHGFRQPHHQRTRDAEEISWLMKHARGIDWTAPPRKGEEKTGTDSGTR